MRNPQPISEETARLWEQMQKLAEPYIREAEAKGEEGADDQDGTEMLFRSRRRPVAKAKPTWEYADEDKNRVRAPMDDGRDSVRPEEEDDDENYNDLENSFSANRFLYHPKYNMYLQKAKRLAKTTMKLRTTTAADNPYDLEADDNGNFHSDSVIYDRDGYNFEPSRAKNSMRRSMNKGKMGGSREPMMMPEPGKLVEGDEDFEGVKDFKPGQLVRGMDDVYQPTNRQRRQDNESRVRRTVQRGGAKRIELLSRIARERAEDAQRNMDRMRQEEAMRQGRM